MENVTIPQIFTAPPPSKKYIEEGAKRVIEIVTEGEICPLKVATALKAMEVAIKIIKDGIGEAVENEAAKESVSTFERNGHSYNVRNSSRYDYSDCNDPVMLRLSKSEAEISEERKGREAFLKTIKSSMTIVDDVTGEMAEVYPPVKLSKTVVAITLAK